MDLFILILNHFKKIWKLAGLVLNKSTKAADRFQEDEYHKESPQDFALWKSHKK